MTVVQIKELRIVTDEKMKENAASLLQNESLRNEALREVGNHLHESCIVSNDEVKDILWSYTSGCNPLVQS